MASESYATLARVLPIPLLALVWDSAYLERLRRLQRQARRMDREVGVLFWIKSRVRYYALFVTGETVVSTAISNLANEPEVGKEAGKHVP